MIKRNRIFFRVQAGLITGLLTVSLLPAAVFAAEPADTQERESILISPVSKRYELNAGDTTTDTLKVVNDGTTTYDFILYARPYSVQNENYIPDFTSEAQNSDAYKWVQFTSPTYRLTPGKSADIDYTIRVPENATPGGHYGVLFAETQPVNQSEGNAVQRKKRVGSILYITVKGDVTTSGKLLSTDVPFFQTIPPLTVTQRVQNTGNTDFTVETTTKISDFFGGLKHTNERSYVVLPSTTRKATIEWPDSAWLGLYKVETTTSFLDTKHSSGQYVLLVPIWVYSVLALLIAARIAYAVSHRKRR